MVPVPDTADVPAASASAERTAAASRRRVTRRTIRVVAARGLEPLAALRVEEVRLVGPGAKRDVRPALRRASRLDPGDEPRLLARGLGRAEHVGVGAELLDDLDVRRQPARSELQRLGPQ